MSDDPSSGAMSASESQALTEGQRLFGKYLLRRFLGRGPLGAAWLVMDESIGREMAMRFLPGGWFRDDRIKDALQAALGRWRELAHPHIVSAQNLVSEGLHSAIVTRFFEGETLHELKSQEEERCFSVSRIIPWMAQLCDALDYALRHHQIVHGDINPLNLLISKDDQLRVADFGLASSLFHLQGPDGAPVLVGTLAYISPERARGAEVTVADDVYAFGATVYDALTSRPPFFRGNILWQLESLVAPSMTDRRTELSLSGESIPPEWEEVVAACLSKQPGNRPKSIREVGERLGLLAPMPPSEGVNRMLFQRTSEESTPTPPRRPTEHVEIYPSSMPTAGMEAMTMVGIPNPPEDVCEGREVAAVSDSTPQEPAATEKAAEVAPVEAPAPLEAAALAPTDQPGTPEADTPAPDSPAEPVSAGAAAEEPPVTYATRVSAPLEPVKEEPSTGVAEAPESTLRDDTIDEEPMTIIVPRAKEEKAATVSESDSIENVADPRTEPPAPEVEKPFDPVPSLDQPESKEPRPQSAPPPEIPALSEPANIASPIADAAAVAPSANDLAPAQPPTAPPSATVEPAERPADSSPQSEHVTADPAPLSESEPPLIENLEVTQLAVPPRVPPLPTSETPQAGVPHPASESPLPDAPPTASPPPEPAPPVPAPPPSVVAIPPMDPSLERTLPQYPTVGNVALPSAPPVPVASPAAAVPEVAPPAAPPLPAAPPPVPVAPVAPPLPVQSPSPVSAAPPPLAPVPPPIAAPPKEPKASTPQTAPPASTPPAVPAPKTPPPIPVATPAKPAPAKPAPSLEDTDASASPAVSRPPTSAAAPARTDYATSVPIPAPQPQRRSNLPWVIAACIVALLAIGGGVMFAKKLGKGNPPAVAAAPDPGTANSIPQPVDPPPIVRPPTPPPPVAATSGRALELRQVAELVGKGAPREKLLLVGELKVISAIPPGPGQLPQAVLRPADASLYGTIRVMAIFPAGAALPPEGKNIRWSEADGFVVGEVTKGGDGQITVNTTPARP